MPVPQQLSQIPILRTRYPDSWKAVFQQQLPQQSGILGVGLRLPDPLGFDLGGIADPQLEIKFSQQSLEPARIPGSLHAYPHADSLRFHISIEVARFSVAVVQSSFTTLTSLFNQKCNLLKARVIIYSYNHHVRLLPPERLVVNQSILGSREPTLLCHHLRAPKSTSAVGLMAEAADAAGAGSLPTPSASLLPPRWRCDCSLSRAGDRLPSDREWHGPPLQR